MEKLVEIEVIEFFLVNASMNVNWEGSSADVERDKLITIARVWN